MSSVSNTGVKKGAPARKVHTHVTAHGPARANAQLRGASNVRAGGVPRLILNAAITKE
jgi:hypothetical protein